MLRLSGALITAAKLGSGCRDADEAGLVAPGGREADVAGLFNPGGRQVWRLLLAGPEEEPRRIFICKRTKKTLQILEHYKYGLYIDPNPKTKQNMKIKNPEDWPLRFQYTNLKGKQIRDFWP